MSVPKSQIRICSIHPLHCLISIFPKRDDPSPWSRSFCIYAATNLLKNLANVCIVFSRSHESVFFFIFLKGIRYPYFKCCCWRFYGDARFAKNKTIMQFLRCWLLPVEKCLRFDLTVLSGCVTYYILNVEFLGLRRMRPSPSSIVLTYWNMSPFRPCCS